MWVALLGCDAGDEVVEPIVVARAPCGFAEAPAGVIDVSERADVFHTGVYARVDAVLQEAPSPNFHEVATEAGACRHYHYAPASCDPICADGEVCTAESTCAAFPGTVSGGTLSVEGLAVAVTIDAEDYSPGSYYGPGGLPSLLFEALDPIGARLAGGEVPALTLGTEGVVAMDTALVDSGYTLTDGNDATFTWTPGPDPEACVAVVLNGFNVSHGAPLSDIVRCETTDTGSVDVPRAMVDAFPHGTTPEVTEGYDWPHATLSRYTRARADTEFGPIELLVRSTSYFLLEHPER